VTTEREWLGHKPAGNGRVADRSPTAAEWVAWDGTPPPVGLYWVRRRSSGRAEIARWDGSYWYGIGWQTSGPLITHYLPTRLEPPA
jgi:hypothetical protein